MGMTDIRIRTDVAANTSSGSDTRRFADTASSRRTTPGPYAQQRHATANVVESMLAAEITRIRVELTAQVVATNANADGQLADDGPLTARGMHTGVEPNLPSPLDRWSQSLMFVLETDLTAESRTALTQAEQAASEAEAELDRALDAALSASSCAQAHAVAIAQAKAAFEAAVRNDARVQAMADTDFGDVGAAAMTEVLLQVHATVD